jgi:hypothetical protein
MDNEQLLREKAITAADALASSGKLNPAQSDKFIDYVVDESVLQDNVRVVRFRNEQLNIDKIGIGKRVMQPAAEYVAPDQRSGVSTSQITLTPKEVIAAFDISDAFKELSLEGESVEDHIVKMFATGWRNDAETLALCGDIVGQASIQGDVHDNGDTAKYIKDPLLAMFDGWMRTGDSSHLVNAGGSNIGLSVFGSMIRAMPQKFRRNKANLRFFMSSDLAQIYIEKVATRATPKGDAASEGQTQTPFGIPIVEVPLLSMYQSIVQHVVLSGTTKVTLRYSPMTEEVVLPSTLAGAPTTKYIKDTDYEIDYATGQINRKGGGAIGDGATVKVTYKAYPQILLTHMQNFILGIGRDIRMEKQRNIHKRANEYVVTAKVSVNIEETDALVKAYNIGVGV